MYFFGFSITILFITLLLLLFKIKNLKRFYSYFKTVKKYREDLKKYNISIDWIYRMYTVKNFDIDLKDDIKVYGYELLDTEVRKFIREIQGFLKSVGLFEFIGTSKIDRIAEYSVLIVIESIHLNTKKFAIWMIISILLMLLGVILGIFL